MTTTAPATWSDQPKSMSRRRRRRCIHRGCRIHSRL